MAIKNTNLSPLLKEGTGIALTSAGQVITITSTGAGALPAGSDTQVQFNDAGVLGADAGLTYNKTLNILGLEAIDFAVTPTAGTAERRLLWDNDEGSLNLTLKGGATNIALGAEVAIMSYNAEATTLNKGEVVYLFGAQGQRPSVKRAVNTSDATSATTFGMVAESIASGATGFVMQMGIVRNIDTNAYNEGDILYLGSTAGSVTTTKPSAPAHMVFVGVVLKKNASSGRIFVKPQNGYELSEIHDIALSSVANNDLLVYESSSTLWKNKSISTILGYTPEQPLTFSSPLSRSTNTISIPVATSLANGYLSSTDWSTFNGKQNALSGTGIVKSTSGTISYLTDNSTNWDTAYTNRITSLTTTGSSGASTLVSNTLNIPNYTLAGLGGFANPMTTLGDIIYQNASSATRLAGSTSASKVFLSQTGTGTASAAPAWSAVTKSDVGLGSVENTALSTWAGSTNITTLGTIGTGTWSASTIAVDKGGTGATTLTGVIIGSGTSSFTAVAGTASQLLRRNAGNTAYEFFTPTYLTSAITSLGGLTASTQTFANDTNVTITSATSTHTLGWSGQLAVSRGGTGLSALGTSLQLLRVNTGATALEYFTPTYLTSAITSLNSQTGATQTFANDTNVTITSATNTHTIGWSGQLSIARGGTGQSTATAAFDALSPTSTLGDLIYHNGTDNVRLAGQISTAKQYLSQTGTGTVSAAPSWATISGSDITGSALTKTDDTNVTLTLGGTPTTALLRAASLTLGWTGQLSVARGGTGLSALGTANQLIRVNAGATALEYFTPSYLTSAITSLGGLTASTQTFANDTNVTITSATSTHTLGWSGQLSIARGGTNSTATPTNGGISYGTGTAYAFTSAGTSGQALVSAGASAPSWTTLTLENLPGAWVKKAVDCATTAALTLNTAQTTIDGVTISATSRVLVKNQATASQNGIYTNMTTTSWTRSTDADTAGEIAGGSVNVDAGTTNGGLVYHTDFKATDTLGTTAMNWYRSIDSSYTIPTTQGGTGLTSIGTANQLIRVNAGATALEYFTPSYLTSAITSLGGLSTATQTFATSTTGTDFTISSATSTHTFNLPIASATNTGKLSSSDWTTFNNKLSTAITSLGGLTASTQTFANDTNVTITSATSTHTLGWTGQLSVGRGGTGASTLTGVLIGNGTSAVTAVAGTASQLLRRNAGNTAYEFFTFSGMTNPMTTLGDIIYEDATPAPARLAGNITTTKQYLSQTGTGTISAVPAWSAIAGSDVTGAALTKTDDTNVTLTLGGTPTTSLLRATSLTLGWTGQLAVSRGGTGLSALGTANQLIRVNAGASALEYFTPTYLTSAITSLGGLTASTQTFANDTNVTITSATSTHTLGWSGQLAISRGGTGVSSVTTTPTASAFAGWDANSNLSADNFLGGYTTTATSGITTTLVVGSTYYQYFTGTSTQTIVLPVVTTLVNGFAFRIVNLSTGNITINTSGGNAVQVMASNTQLFVYVINTAGGTGTASWDWNYSIVKNANLPATIAGATTANAIAKFNSSGGLIADSNITDNGTTITTSIPLSATGGISNASFEATNAGVTNTTTWLGTSTNTTSAITLNRSTSTSTITANNNYIAVPILSTTLTEASSGTHNFFANVAIKALSLTDGVANTTYGATLYVEGAATGTATIPSNYALWVDDGVSRFDGLSLFNSDFYNNHFYSSGNQTSTNLNWLGSSSTYYFSTIINQNPVAISLPASNNFTTQSILSRSLTTASSGTHNFISSLAIKPVSITANATTPASVTNSATLYIENSSTGTATITNNYALWIDDGVTRLDGTAIINGADATTNSVKSAGYFQGSLTTGTPAVGIGTSFAFNTQTAASNYELGSVISSISTNVTSTTEAFDLAFANMTGGATATERMRLKSTGQLQLNAYTTGTTFSGTPVGTLMTTSAGNVIIQESSLQFTSLNISATQVNSAFTTPVTLVSSPGAGKIIVPHTLVFFLNSAGTAFATNTNYGWMLGATLISATKSFAGTTDFYNIDTPTLTNGGTAVANAPLQWKVQTGNSTLGTGATISIGVVYSILSVS